MNRDILIALLGALLALALGYAVLQSTSDVPMPGANPAASSIPSMSESLSRSSNLPANASRAQRAGSTEPEAVLSAVPNIAAAEAAWTEAAGSHRTAERALKESEQSLSEAEREIEAVERFIEDGEERGDDPADLVEEGMAKLQPAIARFEARLEIVERNERLEAQARARLEAAEAELARVLRNR